ncbi:amidase family protein [Micromonospora sp. BRA006-A]|nr:amidase family protein [Micromonospora sp. BRA006-A]
MTVKDVFETAGLVTTAGAPELAGHRPDRDAEAVARLRRRRRRGRQDQRAAVRGRLQTDNPVYRLTRNPWDPGRTAGGSSGGSAAALAAGLTPAELGSDIAGSIRLPSHFCGVYGHLPTFSAVPTRGTSRAARHARRVAAGRCRPDGPAPGRPRPGAGRAGGRRRGRRTGRDAAPGAPATRRISGCRIAVWLDNPLMRTDRETRGCSGSSWRAWPARARWSRTGSGRPGRSTSRTRSTWNCCWACSAPTSPTPTSPSWPGSPAGPAPTTTARWCGSPGASPSRTGPGTAAPSGRRGRPPRGRRSSNGWTW